jgi:hypothetical protein
MSKTISADELRIGDRIVYMNGRIKTTAIIKEVYIDSQEGLCFFTTDEEQDVFIDHIIEYFVWVSRLKRYIKAK